MIAVGTTCAPWKADGSECDWLTHAEAMRESHPDGVLFFAALERDRLDSITREFEPLLGRLRELEGHTWPFYVDDGWVRPSTEHRLIKICTGRNLVIEYALRAGASHVLFADSDVTFPPDVIPRLLEVDLPVVGAHVAAYCLDGPRVEGSPFDLRQHWNTAGALLVRADVLRKVRWRHELYPPHHRGPTDDPCFAEDAERAGFGPTVVRHDVVCSHAPLVPVEAR